MLQQAWLDMNLTVPACNRWNTVLGTLCWFMFGFLFHGILPGAFLKLKSTDRDAQSIIDEATQVGLSTDDSWRQLRSARFKKAARWMGDESTGRNLVYGAILFAQATPIMASCFASSRLGNFGGSMLVFASSISSPAGSARSTSPPGIQHYQQPYPSHCHCAWVDGGVGRCNGREGKRVMWVSV